jgi:hypothetical protein
MDHEHGITKDWKTSTQSMLCSEPSPGNGNLGAMLKPAPLVPRFGCPQGYQGTTHQEDQLGLPR